jgi:hypothetical protein
MKRSFPVKLGAVALVASTAALFLPSAAQAATVSQSVTLPAVSGVEFCLEVNGQETCQKIPGLVGGTLTLTLSGDAAAGGPVLAPDTEKCAGQPGVAIIATTGAASGSVSATLTGTNPIDGSAVDQSIGEELPVASNTVKASVCQKK